jgi:RNA polymerase sigma-70 factor (ECF subfamily)
MLRVQAGDDTALPELFRRLSPRVLRYTRRVLQNDARAEEITQDVFVQIIRFRDRYRPESRFITWVFTIATNLCLNELRRAEHQWRAEPVAQGEDARGPVDPGTLEDTEGVGPEAEAAGRELAAALEQGIAALPAKQRAALLLSRLDGLAYRDVAEALGSTESAVKALLFRATHGLKDRLRDFL